MVIQSLWDKKTTGKVDGCKWCAKGECWTHGEGASDGDNRCWPSNGGGQVESCKWCEWGKCWSHPAGQGKVAGRGDSGSGWGSSGRKFVSLMPSRANAKQSPSFKRVFSDVQPDASFEERLRIEQARAELEVVVDGGLDESNWFAPVSTFEELQVLPDYAFLALKQMNITMPMPIQAQALPIILGGHDLVGVAKTGSGKTLAYLLPALVHIEAQAPLEQWAVTPIVLALAPTRELAIQISEEAQKLVAFSAVAGSNHPGGLSASCVYGGMSKSDQLRSSTGAHIVAATPGRLAAHIQSSEMSMDRVTYFVLDEGDRMLDDGFEEQVKAIASAIRTDRHMLFFSATWPKKVQDLARFMCQGSQRPIRLRIGQSSDGFATTRQDIIQEVVVFDQEKWEERDFMKQQMLYAHVRRALEFEGTKVLVFVSRKDLAEAMSTQFGNEGFEADTLHGGRSQDVRLSVLERFKSYTLRLLVTTDVMGRGLDIPTISHIVIYDMGDIEDYVHRIGRTARGPYGQGHALTLFEYNSKWPHLAEGLIKILESTGQAVPDDLRQIANEVTQGLREVKSMKKGSKWGTLSGWQGSAETAAWKKQGYDQSGWGKDWQPW